MVAALSPAAVAGVAIALRPAAGVTAGAGVTLPSGDRAGCVRSAGVLRSDAGFAVVRGRAAAFCVNACADPAWIAAARVGVGAVGRCTFLAEAGVKSASRFKDCCTVSLCAVRGLRRVTVSRDLPPGVGCCSCCSVLPAPPAASTSAVFRDKGDLVSVLRTLVVPLGLWTGFAAELLGMLDALSDPCPITACAPL